MPAAKPKSGGVVAVRASKSFFTPPGPLGWSNLIEPDAAFDSLKFKANIHLDEKAQEILAGRIGKEMDELFPKFLAEAEKAEKAAPRGGWVIPEADAWVDDHLKEPKENSRIQLPFVSFANDAEYRDKKSGKMVRKTMRAYDVQGQMLDLPSLHLGMGSIVQLVLIAGVFVSPLVKEPTPSFKLQGVRVIKLEQFGGGGGSMGEMDDEDMALIGDTSDFADLSAYAAKPKPDASKRAKPGRTDDDLDDGFDDDEIPF